MNRYISDLHLGHQQILKHDCRPWETAEDMDRDIMEIWNYTVSDDDDIWILGDFCYRSGKPAHWYLKQLKGRKHLILGNHDRNLLKNPLALSCFETVDKALEIEDQGNRLVLCHYPMAEWNGYYRGSWHLFGHIHDRKEGKVYEYICGQERMLNCAAAVTGYRPASFGELIEDNRRYKGLE